MRSRSDFYGHQPIAVDFIQAHANCALYIPMGGAKTVSALTAIKDLMDEFAVRNTLVVAPLRVARKVWSDEIEEWNHLQGLTTSKIIGTEAQRLKGLKAKADIHLINRENVQWLFDQFIVDKKQVIPWPWDTVVLDESQSFKSQSSKRWKALRKLRRLFPRMIQLTGTPAPNGYQDLWSQIYLLDGGQRLGATESAYLKRWFREERGDGYSNWYLKEGSAKEIQDAISDIVLSVRLEDYFEVGVPIWNAVRVQLSPAAMATYRRFERSSLAEFNGTTISAVSAGVLGNKLAQLANGSVYRNDSEDFEIFHDAKLEALGELFDGLSGPVVIAYAFRSDATRIAGVLTEYCRREGKTWRHADSDADLDAFANGKVDYILMHPGSAGHGLNSFYKSGSSNIIWFGLTANLEHFQQLNARLTGGLRMLGRQVVIHLIMADGTRDHELKDLLTEKAATQDDLTTALTAAGRAQNKSDNELLMACAVKDALSFAFG